MIDIIDIIPGRPNGYIRGSFSHSDLPEKI